MSDNVIMVGNNDSSNNNDLIRFRLDTNGTVGLDFNTLLQTIKSIDQRLSLLENKANNSPIINNEVIDSSTIIHQNTPSTKKEEEITPHPIEEDDKVVDTPIEVVVDVPPKQQPIQNMGLSREDVEKIALDVFKKTNKNVQNNVTNILPDPGIYEEQIKDLSCQISQLKSDMTEFYLLKENAIIPIDYSKDINKLSTNILKYKNDMDDLLSNKIPFVVMDLINDFYNQKIRNELNTFSQQLDYNTDEVNAYRERLNMFQIDQDFLNKNHFNKLEKLIIDNIRHQISNEINGKVKKVEKEETQFIPVSSNVVRLENDIEPESQQIQLLQNQVNSDIGNLENKYNAHLEEVDNIKRNIIIIEKKINQIFVILSNIDQSSVLFGTKCLSCNRIFKDSEVPVDLYKERNKEMLYREFTRLLDMTESDTNIGVVGVQMGALRRKLGMDGKAYMVRDIEEQKPLFLPPGSPNKREFLPVMNKPVMRRNRPFTAEARQSLPTLLGI